MHSSRMCTVRSSSHLLHEGGGSASVHAGIHPPHLSLDSPTGLGLEIPLARPPTSPPGMDPKNPLARPLNLPPKYGSGDPPARTPQPPPWVWAWRPPWPYLSTSPLGMGQETTPPLEQNDRHV